MNRQALMRIKDLVEQSGVSRTTIHFYLRHGLLHPPHKTGRTMAYYDESHLERLEQIQRIKRDRRLPVSFLKEKIEELEHSPLEDATRDFPHLTEVAATTKAKDRKKEKIVDAAIKVFSQMGYHRTKVQDITDSIRISTGTFYIYFRNKRDLFVQVVDEVIRRILDDSAVATMHEENTLKRMIARGLAFHENYSKYNEILNQLRAEMVGGDKWPRERIKMAYHDLTRPVMRDIQTGIDTGLFRQMDPDLLAYVLTGIIGMMSLKTMIDDKHTFEEIMAFILDFALNGMQARGKTGREMGAETLPTRDQTMA